MTTVPTRHASSGPREPSGPGDDRAPSEERSGAQPRVLVTIVAAALLAVPLLAVAASAVTGGLTPEPLPGLPTTTPGTAWGLRVTQAARDLGAAMTVGILVLAACCAPGRAGRSAAARVGAVEGARAHLMGPVSAAAALWSASCLALIAFAWADAAGIPLSTPGSMEQVLVFATEFELGRALLLSAALAAVVALCGPWVRRTTSVGVLLAIAVVALWPLATVGHSAGDLNHDVGVNSLFGHLLALTVWVGGVVGLVLLARRHPADLPTAARRFSPLAGACFVLVAVSGTGAALLKVDSIADLSTPYGALLVAKTAVLLLLGLAGAAHRRWLLPRIDTATTGAFTRLVVGEVVVLGLAVALGVALSRTDPPGAAAAVLTTPQSLLGYDLPPALTGSRWFTAWRLDTFFGPVALVAVVGYLRMTRRLARRGDRWPVGRTVAWVVGWAVLTWATSGAPGVYGRVLFSMHMVQHMTIATVAPALLALAAPVTLALRALPPRRDGTRGPREWLLTVVHLRIVRLLGHPLVAAPLFIVGLVVFYSTGLFELSLRSHTAHVVMVLHFLVAGYLFTSGLIGIDPGIDRPPFAFRVPLLMVTFGAHAFYSVSLMSSSTVLAEDWFAALGRTWGASAARDQYTGASIGWALGDYPLLVIILALIVQWFRADKREQRRLDRRAHRDGDADLNAYNAYLGELARRHEQR